MSFCGFLLSSVRGTEHIEVMPYFCFIFIEICMKYKLISKISNIHTHVISISCIFAEDFNHFHEYTVAMEQVGPNGKNLKRWNILEIISSKIVKSHVISGCGCARWCKKAPVMEEPHNPQFIQARSALSWPHTHNFYMKT